MIIPYFFNDRQYIINDVAIFLAHSTSTEKVHLTPHLTHLTLVKSVMNKSKEMNTPRKNIKVYTPQILLT